MAADIGICNLALARLGVQAVQSLDDPSQEARACARLYPQARDALLRMHPWNFASKRRALTLLSAAPAFEWAYAYAYPSDCLEARAIWRPEGFAGRARFVVETGEDLLSKVILTDEPDAKLLYTAAVSDSRMFDAGFADALAWRLAAELAQPLAASDSKQKAMLAMFQDSLARSMVSDARESVVQSEQPSPYWDARL